jgi:protein-S-isoprenylcysteine O-methyltransferase Ste14
MTRMKSIFRWFLANTTLAAVAFLSAGRTNLPMFRAYIATFAAITLLAALIVDPGLFEERSNHGGIGLDPFSGTGISILFLSTVAVAAMDAGRFHWTHDITCLTQVTALVFVALFMNLQVWAMTVNPFFSTVIRVQAERGHRPITGGPYRIIRHPGYFAMLFNTPATAIAFGSVIALIPAVLCCLVILRRTIHEDRFLRDELAGYARYMLMVRYRLIPGLW